MADRDRPTPPADDLTDRLRQWEHIPIANEAADEIDRLRAIIAIQKQVVIEQAITNNELRDTIAALRAVPAVMVEQNRELWLKSAEWHAAVYEADARMAAVVEGER